MWKTILASTLAVALVSGHFWFLFDHCPPTFQSADANGYMAQVELVADHGRTELQPISPLSYIGLHWLGMVKEENGEKVEKFYSRYPPGIAWLLAPFYKFLGPEETIYVTPLLGSLTLLLLFFLCRPHIGPWLGLVAVAVYAFQPDANSHALNWGAHTQVGFFLIAGLFSIDSWSRRPTWWRALLGGFCLGAMPTMRPAEVTAGVGVAAFLLYHLFRKGEIRAHYKKHLLIAIAGAMVPLLALMYNNYRAFGSPFSFGYSLTGEQQAGSGFGLEFFMNKWRPFTEMLMSNGAGVFFTLGVLGIFGMLLSRDARGIGIMLLGVLAPVTLTYMAYYWGSDSSGLRFMIPTFPLYTLPALWFIKQTSANKKVMVGAVAAMIALQAVLWVPDTLERAVWDNDRLQTMEDSVEFLDKNLPADSVLITDRQLAETLQYYPKWDLLDASVVSSTRSRTSGRGGFAGRGTRSRTGRTGNNNQNPSQDQNRDPNAPPELASPMQRDKARVLRKQLYAVSGEARQELITSYLEDLAAKKTGGIYWMVSSGSSSGSTRSRFGRGGSSSSGRSAMRRFKFKNHRRFKFVDSVTLSLTTAERERRDYVEEYEKEYGEPPPRSRRGGRGGRGGFGGFGGFAGRGGGNGARQRVMGSRFGPRSGAQYRLYKLADRREVVSVEELAAAKATATETASAAPKTKTAAPRTIDATARKSDGGKPVDATTGTVKKQEQPRE